jgi:hypothetical protein
MPERPQLHLLSERRRRERPPVVSREFAEPLFLMDTGEFPLWLNAKRLVVHHHPTYPRITSVETS